MIFRAISSRSIGIVSPCPKDVGRANIAIGKGLIQLNPGVRQMCAYASLAPEKRSAPIDIECDDTQPMDMPVVDAAPIGLTTAEARQRLKEFGTNAIADDEAPSWRTFLRKFSAPIPWMLEGAIVIQIGLSEYVEAAVVAGLLIFNAVLGFVQESRATATLAALRKKLAPTALVRRDGDWIRLPASELAPGDAIRLPLGALVPADARIVSGSAMVDQSMLTGESIPVEAQPGVQVYVGALVRRGQAIAEVTATGAKTYFGRAAELVRMAHAVSTEQAAILGATRNLAIVNGAVAISIIAYGHALALPPIDLIRLALTALLASIPVALPATFTLSAALAAQKLARSGVLLTRLSAVHEAAAMDVLCADKTGTLTSNTLRVDEISPMPGVDRDRVLALASLASSEADQDPIDATIRQAAAGAVAGGITERLVRLVPFDPATKMSEAFAVDQDGSDLHIVKGAFQAIAEAAEMPPQSRAIVNDLADRGHRVIAVAVGPPKALRLAGLIALSDPAREDSAQLVAALRDMGVRTIMVTGDSAVTAAAIARKVGIADVCPPERFSEELRGDEFGVFARVAPEDKYRLVKALQRHGHVVGMCGDGANDAPALRQAQIGIAVFSATDVAKSAAGMVLTEPGLAGILLAVREGRIASRRLLIYTLNMLVKKLEIVLFLAIGLGLTSHAVLTPTLTVLMLGTNDFLSMSLTTDNTSAAPSPSVWKMGRNTVAAVILGACKLGFSTAILAFGAFRLRLGVGELQTLAFVTLVFGNQALIGVLRERRHFWGSRPSAWVIGSSAANFVIVSALAWFGVLMAPIPMPLLAAVLGASAGFVLILDQFKLLVLSILKLE